LPGAVLDTDGDGLSNRQETEVTMTDPNKADTDGDTFDDHAEVISGSDPNDINSLPSGLIRATSMSLGAGGLVTINFTLQGVDLSTVLLESNSDLSGDWAVENGASITPVSANTYRATTISTEPDRQFFRIRGTGDGNPTSVAAGFAASRTNATEGDSDSVSVLFSSPFTGYFEYTVTGVDSSGKHITPFTESIEVDGSSSVALPIVLGDDSSVGQLSRYEITLNLTGASSTPSSGYTQLIVLDNDEEWAGSLVTGGQAITLRLRITKLGATHTATLISESPSGFFPIGEYPMTLARHAHDDAFELNPVGSVPLARSDSSLPGSAMDARLFLLAEKGVAEQVIDLEGGRIEGAYLLGLIKPGASFLTSSPRGTFTLFRQPAKPNLGETELESAP
jgi:hypothetical protein